MLSEHFTIRSAQGKLPASGSHLSAANRSLTKDAVRARSSACQMPSARSSAIKAVSLRVEGIHLRAFTVCLCRRPFHMLNRHLGELRSWQTYTSVWQWGRVYTCYRKQVMHRELVWDDLGDSWAQARQAAITSGLWDPANILPRRFLSLSPERMNPNLKLASVTQRIRMKYVLRAWWLMRSQTISPPNRHVWQP